MIPDDADDGAPCGAGGAGRPSGPLALTAAGGAAPAFVDSRSSAAAGETRAGLPAGPDRTGAPLAAVEGDRSGAVARTAAAEPEADGVEREILESDAQDSLAQRGDAEAYHAAAGTRCRAVPGAP